MSIQIEPGGMLVVVNGPAGSGKSTLVSKLEEKYHLKIFSVDDEKVTAYVKYGFKNLFERKYIRKLAVGTFLAEVTKYARTGNSMILDYTFKRGWQKFFDYISEEYGYDIVVINCTQRSVEDILQTTKDRYTGKLAKHESLKADAYIVGEIFKTRAAFVLSPGALRERARDIQSGRYLKITGTCVYTDSEILQECFA